MIKKYLGIVFFLLGIIMIISSLYFSYKIFTGSQQAPQIFSIKSEEGASSGASLPSNLQEQINKIVNEKIKEIFPQEYINKLLNLMSWSVFAWILLTGGSTVASLGIKMLK